MALTDDVRRMGHKVEVLKDRESLVFELMEARSRTKTFAFDVAFAREFALD